MIFLSIIASDKRIRHAFRHIKLENWSKFRNCRKFSNMSHVSVPFLENPTKCPTKINFNGILMIISELSFKRDF